MMATLGFGSQVEQIYMNSFMCVRVRACVRASEVRACVCVCDVCLRCVCACVCVCDVCVCDVCVCMSACACLSCVRLCVGTYV